MIQIQTISQTRSIIILTAMASILILIQSLPAYGHGGKTHGDESFTAFQAAQKAIQLYDRLVTSGKLPEEWEIGLHSIKISTRTRDNKRESVVQFERVKGDPGSVYFFFDEKGKYSGSNFTGK